MTARIPRLRRYSRIAGEEYALPAQDQVRPGAGPFSASRNAKTGHDVSEGRRVTSLPGGEYEGLWLAAGIRGWVDLWGQSAVGPADGVVLQAQLLVPRFACSCHVLVCAHDGRVERNDPVEVFVGVRLGDQRGEQPPQVPLTAHICSRL